MQWNSEMEEKLAPSKGISYRSLLGKTVVIDASVAFSAMGTEGCRAARSI